MLQQEMAHLSSEVAGKDLDAIQKSFFLVVELEQLFPTMGLIKGDLGRQLVQLLTG